MNSSPMDGEKFRGQLSSIAFGNVMAAAARDYQKEVQEGEKKNASVSQADYHEFDLDALAEDPELERLHARRIADMKRESERRQALQRKGHGEYREISEEQFLEEVTGSQHVVAHFFHKEFVRCKVVDKHLALLAPKHVDTKFIKVDAERCPFFITKLAIKVLPTMVLFRGGVAVDRVVGFEELGGDDTFPTSALEARLRKAGLISAPSQEAAAGQVENPHWQKNVRTSAWNDDSDSDSD